MNAATSFALLVLLLFPPAAVASFPEGGAAPDQVLLVHVTSPLTSASNRTALVTRVVAAALKKGQRVVLLFDAEGVTSLKMGRWFGGHSTPLDHATISEQERKHLAVLLGTTADDIPDIYGSLLHFLRGRGVAIYVSKQALALHSMGDDQYDHAAEAVGEDRIVDLLTAATAYVSY
jgi:hypothetical protein